jgi:hypothetical protein
MERRVFVVTLPAGRGRWRVTLHERSFTPEPLAASLVAEIHDARGRALTQALNQPARFTFTVDGRSPTALLVQELRTDVVAWRWDETNGVDVPYFRGIVAQGEDQLTEQSHTVTFTCHDMAGMIQRRYLTQPANYAQVDQDSIVADLLSRAVNMTAANGTALTPGSFLPLSVRRVNGDGSSRSALSGELRDRNYTAASSAGQLIDDLSKVISIRDPTATAYDYDVVPAGFVSPADTTDGLRVFYPAQGVARPDVVLEYGATVSTVTRSANSTDYANFVRVTGKAPDGAATGTPPMFSERWNNDANNVGRVPVGLWQNTENASDVSVQSTLDQKAAGDLNLSGVLVPSYALGLRPDVYRHGWFRMGDTVGLVIQSGRLDVFSDASGGGGVRVVGQIFGIGDDGDETVSLTVGRPRTTLVDLLRAGTADVDALVRR